jgi:hypothetical protein
MASPAGQGHQLVAAGLLLIAGVVDGDQLIDGADRLRTRKGSPDGYDPVVRPSPAGRRLMPDLVCWRRCSSA